MPHETYTEGDVVELVAYFLTPQTRGSILAGSLELTVVDATGFGVSDPFFVEGAGDAGGDLLTSIDAIAGNVLTLTDAAAETVTLAQVGKRVNPTTVTFTVKQPPLAGGTTETFAAPPGDPALTNPATGKWQLTYAPPSHGNYRWKAAGTGVAAGAEVEAFVVERDEL